MRHFDVAPTDSDPQPVKGAYVLSASVTDQPSPTDPDPDMDQPSPTDPDPDMDQPSPTDPDPDMDQPSPTDPDPESEG